MQTLNNIHLFAGPTLYQTDGSGLEIPPNIRLHKPATRGDIRALLTACEIGERATAPGTIVLVDGLFQQQLAVGHQELRAALEQNWKIYGLASMGAIRAYEMRAFGMQGYGQIYRMFETEYDFQDDEVALLHGPDPPYRPLSEPLVHFRYALSEWIRRGILPHDTAVSILKHLKSLWFGERTLMLFQRLVLEAVPSQAIVLETEWNHFDPYRLKTIDLRDFLSSYPDWAISSVSQR